MSIPPWQVTSWSAVCTNLQDWRRAARKLRHLGTSVHVHNEDDRLRYGQVLWGTELHDRRIGIAWDWTEIQVDVVAMADPMTLVSNILLIADDGSLISEGQRLLYLNGAIHALHWQGPLCSSRRKWVEAIAA